MGLFGRLFGVGKKPARSGGYGPPKGSAPPSKLPKGGSSTASAKPRKAPAYRGSGGGYLTEEEIADFLLGEPLFVYSSNVGPMAQYHPDSKKLMVEFLNGSAYLYSDVSETEAESFAVAPSKGNWVWDNLRVRGTADQHRKSYVRLK